MKFCRESDQARMVRKHLQARGLTSPRLLQAFAQVPREEFVPAKLKQWAYEDRPLDIGSGQTISQPYIVALTVDRLHPNTSASCWSVSFWPQCRYMYRSSSRWSGP